MLARTSMLSSSVHVSKGSCVFTDFVEQRKNIINDIISILKCIFFVFFKDRVSLCNSASCPGMNFYRKGWPSTHRDRPACTTSKQKNVFF